jgi:hypothetical protein
VCYRPWWISLALVTASASSLLGQAGCLPNETLNLCWKRVTAASGGGEAEVAGAIEQSADEGESRVEAKSTGIGSLGNGLASTVGDFLPTLAAAIGLTQTTTEDGGAAFETNLLLPLGPNPQRVRVQALLRKPSLFQPLADTLPAATRDARRAALEGLLDDFDDVRISAAWNLENGSFGRSFARSRQLYNAYFATVVRRTLALSEIQQGLRQDYRRLIQALASDTLVAPGRAEDTDCADDTQPDLLPLDCLTEEARLSVDSAAVTAARRIAARGQELHAALSDQGFYEFVALVNNQPQLSLEASLDLRRDLAGPNAWALRLRYEGGFSNVNGLRGFCKSRGVSESAPECLRTYLAAPGVRSSIRRGDRFHVSVEVSRRGDYEIALPTDGVTLALSGSWDLAGSVGFGRYLAVNQQGEEVGRVDVAGEYVYHHDDPQRQNRVVLTATYTQRLTTTLSVAAGVSYGSRPEFVGDVNKKVSANFGLRYKVLNN